MKDTKRTDLELLELIKNSSSDQETSKTSERARDILWNRYSNKTKSSFFKNRTFFNQVGLSYDDYLQESYLRFLEAINYIDLNKMKSSNSHFGTSYYWYLLKTKNKLQRDIAKNGLNIYLSEFDKKSDSDKQLSNRERNYQKSTAVTLEEELEKKTIQELVQQYINSQCLKVKKILELYLSDTSVKEIAIELEMKYSAVYQLIRIAKNEITELYNNSIA